MSSPLNTGSRLDTGTSSQSVDARCMYSAVTDPQQSEDVKKQLDPQRLTEFACKVIKHPDCCAPCAANNDCEKLPMHVGCRCRRDDYLTFDQTIF